MPYKKPLQRVVSRTRGFDTNIKLALLLTAVVVVWMLTGIFSSDDITAETVDTAPKAAEVLLKSVAVTNIENKPFIDTVRLTAVSNAKAVVTVKAQTDGRVMEVVQPRGSHVKKSDVILKLDPESKTEQLAAAMAALKEAESLYNAARSLNKQGYRADTSLEGQKSQLEAAKQAVKSAQDALDFANVSAPFDGYVDDRLLNVGDYAKAGDNLFVMLDTSTYLIEAYVSQKKRHLVHVGKQATFSLINGDTVLGTVDFVAKKGDETTKTFKVLVKVDGEKYTMPVNMTGELSIPTEQTTATLIPYSALVLSDIGNLGAMIVDTDDIAHFYEIDPLADSGEGYYIQSLPETSRLIVKGQNSVNDGEKVLPETLNVESDITS